MNRTEQRDHVFKLVFEQEFYDKEELIKQLPLYFEIFPQKEEEAKEVLDKANEIISKREEIDNLINEKTTGWKTSRMNKVDLSILRLAVYEILWDETVPTKVAINEAVELAKKYSGKEGPSFVNGVLAKFA
ncbi:MAG TPA: transcription antitermination factor NusB [Candidatus Dorea intestinavium]|nr:transcription antitermination factor NusB [Candidatus Dorea intestinavium]